MPGRTYWRMNLAGLRNPVEPDLSKVRISPNSFMISRDGTKTRANPPNFHKPLIESHQKTGEKGGSKNDGGDGGDFTGFVHFARMQAIRFISRNDVGGLVKMITNDEGIVFKAAIDALRESSDKGRISHSLVRAVLKEMDWGEHSLQMCSLMREYTVGLISNKDIEGMRLIMDVENSVFPVTEAVRVASYNGIDISEAMDELECFIDGASVEDFWEVIPTLARFAIKENDAGRVGRLLQHGNREARKQMMYWLNCANEQNEDIDAFIPIIERSASDGLIDLWCISPNLLSRIRDGSKTRSENDPQTNL
jgi:hypothetical protein